MAFLKRELDDRDTRPCGRCANCIGQPLLAERYSEELMTEAVRFLQHCHQRIEPRKRWPVGAFVEHDFKGRITDD